MRRLLSRLVEDFRRQDQIAKWLMSFLVIGIVGYAAGTIVLWRLT
jgi:hypothetical protein